MKTPRDPALERIERESADHIQASADSIEQSSEHIRQSKAAIQRSLHLLRETAPPRD